MSHVIDEAPRRRRISPALVLGVAAVSLLAGALWALWSVRAGGATASMTPPEGGDLPILYPVPPFRLTASDGSEVTDETFSGRPWVGDFIFTTCAGVCPIMSSQMARLQESLTEEHPLRLVSITVDPAHDTPEVLREYAARYGARPDRWLFLTGEPEAIFRLAKEGFHLAAGELPEFDPEVDDGPFFHSKHMVLVDAKGRIRSFYDGTDPDELARLIRDLDKLPPPA